MPIYLDGVQIREDCSDLMISASPAQVRMLDGYENPIILTNIGNLTHPDNKTRLKLFIPSRNTLYLCNTFEKIMVALEIDANSPCCVGFRESGKIPSNRRYGFRGDDTELLDAAADNFKIVSKEDYKM